MIQNAHICQLIKINGVTVKMHLFRYFNFPWLLRNVIFFLCVLDMAFVMLAAKLLVVPNMVGQLFIISLISVSVADSCDLFMPWLFPFTWSHEFQLAYLSKCFYKRAHVHAAISAQSEHTHIHTQSNWWMYHIRMVEFKVNGGIVMLFVKCVSTFTESTYFAM